MSTGHGHGRSATNIQQTGTKALQNVSSSHYMAAVCVSTTNDTMPFRSPAEKQRSPVWLALDEVQVGKNTSSLALFPGSHSSFRRFSVLQATKYLRLSVAYNLTLEEACVRSCYTRMPLLQDPMNFGAVLRCAYFLGVDRVVATAKNR